MSLLDKIFVLLMIAGFIAIRDEKDLRTAVLIFIIVAILFAFWLSL